MRISLSARVAFGLVAQMVLFGGAAAYLVQAADDLFEELSVIEDDFDPIAGDLRAAASDLRGLEEMLASARGREALHLKDLLKRSRLPARLTDPVPTLRRIAAGPRADVAEGAGEAADLLEDTVHGSRLVPLAMKSRILDDLRDPPRNHAALWDLLVHRLVTAAESGRDADVELCARELVRLARFARATASRAENRVASASREARRDFLERRSTLSVMVVAVLAGTLVVALLVMTLTLAALRPLPDLVRALRRLAKGQPQAPPKPGRSARLAPELQDLAVAIEDLTEALRTREADLAVQRDGLMQAERLAVVGRMASVVAHEVRNPLNSIALNADLLHELITSREGADPKVVDLLSAVQREVDRLAEITEEYLRFGRLPKGVLAPCDACRVVTETRTFMDGEFAAAGIAVALALPDGPASVIADESQLRQALVNVLRNAVEAMREGGGITMTVRPRADLVELSVTDTGCGIPESFRARLFEPFATTKERGTGLGLAFVKQVAHESGGDVEIESEPGRGTIVRLILRAATTRENG
jgi:signal transduction histidine kinase